MAYSSDVGSTERPIPPGQTPGGLAPRGPGGVAPKGDISAVEAQKLMVEIVSQSLYIARLEARVLELEQAAAGVD